MKKLLRLLPVVGILMLMASCTQSDAPADALKLLGHVPENSACVVVMDIESILDHTGGKASGTELRKGEDLREAFGASKSLSSFLGVLDGNSTVEFTSAVVFEYQGRPYVGCVFGDSEKFRSYVESNPKLNPGRKQWEKEGDFYTLGNYTLYQDICWIAPAEDLSENSKAFKGLSKVESFLNNPYSETLSKCGHDVQWWGSINGLVEASGMGFGDRTTFRMISGMLFDDAKSICGYGDLKGTTLSTVAQVLDGKGKTAKCQLKFGEIDGEQVKALEGNANVIGAVAVTGKLVKQVIKGSESFGGAMPKAYSRALEPIDGTLAYASESEKPGEFKDFRASVATDGNQAPLMELLQGLGFEVQTTDKLLKFSSGSYGNGQFTLADASEKLNGAALGLMCRTAFGRNSGATVLFLVTAGSDTKIKTDINLPGKTDYFLVNAIYGFAPAK